MGKWTGISAFVLATTAIAAGAFFATGTADDFRLLLDNRPVTARVVSTDCADHSTVVYEFDVAGRREMGVRAGNCQLQPGDSVPAYYLPADPRINRLGSNPTGQLWNNLIPILMFSLTVTTMLSLQISRARRT